MRTDIARYCMLEEVDGVSAVLSSLLDKDAPLVERVVTLHPAAPWYRDKIKEEKRLRNEERRRKSSGLTADRNMYVDQCNSV